MTDPPRQAKHADWPPFVRRALLDLPLRFAPAFEDRLHSLYGASELPMSGLPERVYPRSASMCLHPEARRVRAIANAALLRDEAIPTLVGNDTKLLALAAVLFLTDRRNAQLFQDPAALADLEVLMASVLRTFIAGALGDSDFDANAWLRGCQRRVDQLLEEPDADLVQAEAALRSCAVGLDLTRADELARCAILPRFAAA